MKRQYFLHRQNEPLTADTVIYHVWVGESDREQRFLSELKAWAGVNHATLMLWSEDISFYLFCESERIFTGRGLLDLGFVRVDIKVSEALQLARANNWEAYENNLSQPKSFFNHIRFSNPSKVDATAGRIRPNKVLTSPRKYLSQSVATEPSIISFI